MRYYRRNVITISKLLCAVFVVLFYLLYVRFDRPVPSKRKSQFLPKPRIQCEEWKNDTGRPDGDKLKMVARAMRDTYQGYLEQAWGHDDILPVTGGTRRSRNGWAVFIVDSTTTLVVMRMWNELQRSVEYIINNIDFDSPIGVVDPFETTIRYLGALVSLIDLYDAGVIPTSVLRARHRAGLVKQAITLANNLLPAYDTETGLPWPNVNFNRHTGTNWDPKNVDPDDHPTIGPARAGSNYIENCALSNITSDDKYCATALRSWQSLVWNQYIESPQGLIDSPIEVKWGHPVGREKSWDAKHDSYYEYLLKSTILFPSSPYNPVYAIRWMEAAHALRWNLTTRSAPTPHHAKSHLFMGKLLDNYYLNEQSHLSCFAAGTIFLGSKHLQLPTLLPLAQSLLEACRHVYASTPTGLGPEKWSWSLSLTSPSPVRHNQTFHPQTAAQVEQLQNMGFWVVDPRYRLRPEYVESLFYAYRVTGQERYRVWAWEAFEAMNEHCRTEWGFAGVADVMVNESASRAAEELAKKEAEEKKVEGGLGAGFWGLGAPKAKDRAGAVDKNAFDEEEEGPGEWDEEMNWIDEQESFWPAETLKYLYLIFEDVERYSLDEWVFSTEGHLFRRRD